MREKLFDPLDMSDTRFSVPDHKLDRFAACYERASDKSLHLQDDPETSHFRNPLKGPIRRWRTGNTKADYAHFCEMLVNQGQFRGRQLIGRPTLDLMTRNHLGGASLAQMTVGGFSETSNEGVGFGLGFASTIDAAASGTVGEGDFYWGDLPHLILGRSKGGSLCDFHGAAYSLHYLQLPGADQEFGLWRVTLEKGTANGVLWPEAVAR